MKLPNASDVELDLIPFDGRLYDIKVEDGVLSLKLRRGVAWERSLILAIVVLSWLGVAIFLSWLSARSASSFFSDLLRQISMALMNYGGIFLFLVTRQSWTLDRNSHKIFCGGVVIAPLTSVYALKAWRKGAKFHLALKSKNDKPRQLGSLGFCRSEHAWRQDAAQIAEFLGVPLEIPPI